MTQPRDAPSPLLTDIRASYLHSLDTLRGSVRGELEFVLRQLTNGLEALDAERTLVTEERLEVSLERLQKLYDSLSSS